jgi:hypothetical protein
MSASQLEPGPCDEVDAAGRDAQAAALEAAPPEADRESFAVRRVMPPALVAMLAVLAGCRRQASD